VDAFSPRKRLVALLLALSSSCVGAVGDFGNSELPLGGSGGGGIIGAGGGAPGGGGPTAGGGPGGGGGGGVPLENFSFFVTSWSALHDLAKAFNGSDQGFGGDLRYGEVGPGAGLRGADKLCATIAERSMPGSASKGWRAFLSATNDGTGKPVHAIDRLGPGPWYDRVGRTFARTKTDLLQDRPNGIDPSIRDDFPNEDGIPNHDPDGTGEVDNHDFLTGTNAQGKLYSATATCGDWTSTSAPGMPRTGHTWPRVYSGVNWMSSIDESGCKAGINLIETGGPGSDGTVGSGGGYGGFYCFASIP
jgi:hypothetical protein